MNILALDIGSSSVKAAYCRAGRLGRVVRVAFPTRHDGLRVEISPATLLRAVDEAIAAVARGRPALDGIALDTFSSGVIALDARSGRPRCHIITHQDRRSLGEARRIEAAVGRSRHLRIAGNRPVPGGIGSTSLAWLARHQPGVFRGRNGVYIGQTSSLIIHHLTGEWVIDPSQATFLGLYDIRAAAWSEELCAAAGVKAQWLPRLAFADEMAGRVRPGIGRRLGIAAGVPVVGGLIDTGAAVVATGMPIGQLVHNAGSTDVLALCLPAPHPAADILTRPVGTGAALPARWLAASTIAAAGSAIDWARQTFFRDLTQNGFTKLLATTCRHATRPRPTSTADSLSFSPYLAGDRTSLDQPIAAFSGLTLATTREDLLQALVQSIIHESRRRYVRLSSLQRIRPTVYTMGGASGLARAMHAAWPGAHRFRPIAGEALAGLVTLAQAVLTR